MQSGTEVFESQPPKSIETVREPTHEPMQLESKPLLENTQPRISAPIKQIIGANAFENQILFYVQLQNSTYAWLPSTLVSQQEPQRVIQFYESKLRFNS